MRIIFTLLSVLILFSSTQLSGQSWNQKGDDIQGWNETAQFGHKVKLNLDGIIIAVTARTHLIDSLPSGLLRVYKWEANEWIQIGQDIVGNEGDYLGSNMDMDASGEKIVIAARGSQINGNNQGYLQVYFWNGVQWEQEGMNISGDEDFDFFGSTLGISHDGNRIIAGSYSNDEYGWESGLVRTYQFIDNKWTQIGQDLHGDQQMQYFGSSAEINDDGSIISIGIRNDTSDFMVAGHVKVYKWENGNWEQLGDRIVSTYIQEAFYHEMSMSADGYTIAMGAPNNHEFGYLAGRAIVYEWKDEEWKIKGESLFCEAEVDSYGHSLSLSNDGDKIAISGPYNDAGNPNWMHDSGHIRFFEWNGFEWIQTLTDLDGTQAEERLGYEISLSGDGSTLASGMPHHDDQGFNSGNVKIYGSSLSSSSHSFEFHSINVFPNPAQDQIFLENDFLEIFQVSIYSEIGYLINKISLKPGTNSISIENLPPGIYFLNVLNREINMTSRFVKI